MTRSIPTINDMTRYLIDNLLFAKGFAMAVLAGLVRCTSIHTIDTLFTR